MRWDEEALSRLCREHGADLSLVHLVRAGLDKLPAPSSGHTLARWQALAAVAAINLPLVKLFEGHTDALAIQSELQSAEPARGTLWGTWCAEPPDARLEVTVDPAVEGMVHLSGTKAWCSGAAAVTHAVVSCWNEAGEPCLASVSLAQPGVQVSNQGWQAVGMAATGSVRVRFDHAAAQLLGAQGDYIRRPGFWQGGAGIAACWYGGALGIARKARELLHGSADPHRLAHLGTIDTALARSGAVLRETAAWIDANPAANAQQAAMRARLIVEDSCDTVMRCAGRALGAGPLCQDAAFARAMADLPVFMRQSHAERDLAALGALVLAQEEAPWEL